MQLSCLVLLLAGAAPSMEERGVDDIIVRTPRQMTPPTSAARTTVNSIPVVQRTVTSAERVEDLKTFFTESFKKSGLYIAPVQEKFKPESGVQVTGLDTENLIAYMAMLQPSGKFTTVVIAGANVGKPTNIVRSTDAVAPVFPGSHSITSYHVETVQGMTYASPGTPAEIKQFYRDELAKQGYKEADDMVFVKEHSRAWITISPGLSERNVAIYLQTAPDGTDLRNPPAGLTPQAIQPKLKPPTSPVGP